MGGAGADRIIFNTGLALARILAGHDLKKSISAPRFYLDYRQKLSIEWQPDLKLLKEARKMLPDVEVKNGCDDFFGLLSVIALKSDGSLLTAADQRRDGSCGAIP
jgi:gamma-glutamyltranspeptidase